MLDQNTVGINIGGNNQCYF